MGSHRVLAHGEGAKKTGGIGFLLFGRGMGFLLFGRGMGFLLFGRGKSFILFGRRVMVLKGRPNTCLDVSVNLGRLET